MGGTDARPTLVFVYNVDRSPVALLRDLYQGLRTGETDCHLCDLTFGRLLKDRGWKRFVAALPVSVDFQLRSTFVADHPDHTGPFPAAFLREADGLREVIAAERMNAVGDLDELRALVLETVEKLPPPPD